MTAPRIGSLFSGYGGLDLAVAAVTGGTVAWHCEWEDAPSKILEHNFPGVPNYRDVTKVDFAAVERVDILTGGFPCQDVSLAGRRAGMKEGTRSGLWSEFARAIDDIKPGLVVIENVRGLLSAHAASSMEPCPWCLGDDDGEPALRALGAVLGNLAELGYDARWVGLRAADAGAPHGRYRVFIAAHPGSGRDGRGPTAPGHGEGARTDFAADRPDSRAHRAPLADPGSEAGALGPGLRSAEPSRLRGPRLDDGSAPLAHAGGGQPERGGVAAGLAEASGSREGREEERQRVRDAARDSSEVAWGAFEPAIRRWESALGRPAPSPTLPDGRDGQHRLSAPFVEWMMGLPDGWVTDPAIDISRKDQLKALGNGVVPQQAALALHLLGL